MKNLRRIINNLWSSRKTKLLLSSLLASGLIASAVAVFAGFGPSRPVFDWNNPADQVGSVKGPVLNSFINTPVYGDERAFVDGKDASITQSGSFQDQVPVTSGKDYLIRIYVHNNANPSLNCLPEHKDANGDCTQVDPTAPGISKNTMVRFKILPGVLNGNGITGYISDSNGIDRNGAPLTQVYDTVDLRNDTQAFEATYVPGSATIENQAHPNGMPLPNGDQIVNGGVPIGFDQMDGNLPGCFQYSAYVTIKVHVAAPQLTISKQVRMPGETIWHPAVSAKPGDTVQWLVSVKNTGDVIEHNVVANDLLPPHLTYVPGSAKFYNAAFTGAPVDFNQFVINNGNGGVSFGDYAANTGSFLVRFDTVVNGDFTPCSLTVRNIANTHSNEVPQDQKSFADVTIAKQTCNQPTPPVFSCDLLQADATTINPGQTVHFTVNTTAQNGATVTSYSYNFGDGSTSTSTSNIAQHTYNTAGDFLAAAQVTFDVNGQPQTAGGGACQVQIHVNGQPNQPVFSCDLLQADLVQNQNRTYQFTVNTTALNGATVHQYVFNFGDGQTLNTTNNVVSHTFQSSQNGPFATSVAVQFNVNGQTQTATNDTACVKTISFVTPPTTPPTQLVNTGPGDVLGIFAATTIAGAFIHRLFMVRRFDR